jgi:CxxC motif-containing protein (DUF1111 family)
VFHTFPHKCIRASLSGATRCFLFTLGLAAFAQPDPGPRPGPAAAGGALTNLTANELASFTAGKARFGEIDSVSGTLAAGSGLGPRFNMDSCAGCHAFPDAGGSSPALNPQVAVATKAGAKNTIPPFITASGPVREARFKLNPSGGPDGGVHDLFVIAGRSDADGCNTAQPDFGAAMAFGNLALRIPTPLFGSGLIEAIADAAILANLASNTAQKAALGIAGHENRSQNDGTITRFGWKAQNKSLFVFGAEAYNVEQGVTNDVFPQERESDPGCRYNATPEDAINMNAQPPAASDVVLFTAFMRMLAPPARGPSGNSGNNGDNSIDNGEMLFTSIGCALCHTPSLMTASNATAAHSNQQVNLFSDLLLHRMGSDLADGIAQGLAAGDEFRTAPLWGLGQRLFFLHDGRTSDLPAAIAAHASTGSEANAVIGNHNALKNAQKQDLLRFLRSL